MLSSPVFFVFVTTDFPNFPPAVRTFDVLEHAVACARASTTMGCSVDLTWWVGGKDWTGGSLSF